MSSFFSSFASCIGISLSFSVSIEIDAKELKKVTDAINFSNKIGLKTNAGHGLNYENTAPIVNIPGIEQLHIGHSVISRAVLVGIKQAVWEMKQILK